MGLAGAAQDVRAAGGRPLPVPVDVADAAQVADAADRVETEAGPIDTWVNTAMTSVFAPATEVRSEELRRVTEVVYLGSVHGTMAALGKMMPRDRGTIVQVGSALAFRGIPLQSAYAEPSTRCAGSTTRCTPSCGTKAATSGSPWCTCRG